MAPRSCDAAVICILIVNMVRNGIRAVCLKENKMFLMIFTVQQSIW